jgi:hypothetical protein
LDKQPIRYLEWSEVETYYIELYAEKAKQKKEKRKKEKLKKLMERERSDAEASCSGGNNNARQPATAAPPLNSIAEESSLDDDNQDPQPSTSAGPVSVKKKMTRGELNRRRGRTRRSTDRGRFWFRWTTI